MFLSVKIIVNPAANTGNDNNNNTAVIITDHTNKLVKYKLNALLLILIAVDIKLIAPTNELIPAICNANTVKSTLDDVSPITDNGGYNVQPNPAPFSIKLPTNNNIKLTIKCFYVFVLFYLIWNN